MLTRILLVLVLVGVSFTAVCRDGTDTCDCDFGHGCRSWTARRDQVETIVSCAPGFVVNTTTVDTEFCSNLTTCKLFDGQPPCGYQRNCTGRPSRSYADLDLDCIFYYTCLNQIFFGHQKCPDDTVFDDALQGCNFPQFVPAPCGTATIRVNNKPKS